MPLSTPAGTLTVSVRRARTRPSPLHSPQGCSMTEPRPPQRGQARVVMTWPRNERCTCCTSPRPWQVSQVDGWVPGAVPWPVAGRADDGRLERQLAVDAERRLGQVALDADQRVGALAHPAARPARAGAAAEEGVHDVAEPAEALRERRAGAAGTARQRVAAEVDDLPLLRVGQHLVRRRDRLEALLRVGVGVDVGVQLAGQLAVGLLDLVVGRVLRDAEGAVVVGHYAPASSSPT